MNIFPFQTQKKILEPFSIQLQQPIQERPIEVVAQLVKNDKKLFCKVEDPNKNKYILTDKNKQPLQCYNDKCIIFNEKKAREDNTLFNSNANLDKLFIDTNIQCKAIEDSNGNIVDSELINKYNIIIDNYNIASINKNMNIYKEKKLSSKEIEDNFSEIYLNGNELELMKLMKQNDPNPKIYNLKNEYSYIGLKDDLLIKEDISKLHLDAPREIFSLPLIPRNYNFKAGFNIYMEFTYNSNIDNSNSGQTEYNITLNNDYEYIVDILVVGGGGGGGSANDRISEDGIKGGGGGGGAGSIVYIVNKILPSGIYKIIVGNGGSLGTNGYDSMINDQNNNNIILDSITVKAYGGQSGSSGLTNGNGGKSGDIKKATFWDGKSYVSTIFNGASGGVNFGGGGGGTLNEGKDINGGDGRLIDITGDYKSYGIGGGGSRITIGSNGKIIAFAGGLSTNSSGSGGNSGIPGSPGIVIISYKINTKSNQNQNQNQNQIFCKVEDLNKNQYILTDKFKQPLNCINDKCIISNLKKAAEDPTITENSRKEDLLIDTNIQCKAIKNNIINKSNINFDNYNIVSINKNIVIKNKNNEQLSPEQIENNFNFIYYIDKNNENEFMTKDNFKSTLKKMHEYRQTLLIDEDITKVYPNIISNPDPNPNIISKPSENKNNMYIGIGVGIGVLLLMIAFLFYIRSKSNSNIIDTTSKSSTTRSTTRSRHFSSHK